MIDKTLCEHCVFKIMDDKAQTGCHLNRLKKLPNHTEGLYQVVDTYCSACRNIYWKNTQSNSDLLSLIDKVYEEIKTKFDVIVVCPDDFTIEELKVSLDSIKLSSYHPEKVYISLTHNTNNKLAVGKILSTLDPRYDFMLSFEDDQKLRINAIVNKSKSTFLYFLALGEVYDTNIVSDIDDSINRDMKPKLTFISNKAFVCPSFLYNHFMYEEEPFKRIEEYVKSVTENNSTNSKS